jgi:hypothetical protein
MTTAVQVQYRRGNSAQVASFTGAQGEMVVDTTNNRVVVQDGSTAGGWPAAKLDDAAVAFTGGTINGTALGQTTPAAAAVTALGVGAATPGAGIVNVSGSYQVGGSQISAANLSNGTTGTGAVVLANAPAFTGNPTGIKALGVNEATPGTGIINISGTYQVAGSQISTLNLANGQTGTGEIVLQTSPTLSGTVTGPDSGTWGAGGINGSIIGGTTPAAGSFTTVSLARHAVSDANYTVGSGVSSVAYTAITAARTVALPASTTFNAGQQLLVVDESGSCSATKTITLSANGTDKIDGASSAVINAPYGYIGLESNGTGNWTVIDQGPQVLALNGLAGDVTLAASDGSSISASGSTVTIGGPGGMVNKFRNGAMDVWQRGTSALTATTAGGYTADGWIVLPAGAGVTAAQAGGRLITKNSLQVTGASSVTGLKIKQRIESLMAAAFCSQTVTVQAQVYNGTGSSVTPTLTVNRPSAQDNYGSVTVDVNAASLQACAAGAWTLVAYTFAANAASYNGLEIVFDFGNNFGANTKTVQLAELDIRVTPGAATGLNSNPPPPELRPIGTELALCQRYYQKSYAQAVAPGQSFTGGQGGIAFYYGVSVAYPYATVHFVMNMRATPTFTSYDNAGNSGKISMYFSGAWNNGQGCGTQSLTDSGAVLYPTGNSGSCYGFDFDYTASAEL